jgi:hypothetical protein
MECYAMVEGTVIFFGHCRTDWPQEEGSDLQNIGIYVPVNTLYLSETFTSGNTDLTTSDHKFLHTAVVWDMLYPQHFYGVSDVECGLRS